MITLHTFGPAFGLPDPSPFVTKAEMLLKMAGMPLPHRHRGLQQGAQGQAAIHRGRRRAHRRFTFIRWHIEKKYRFDFDRGLGAEQRAIAWAFEKMAEDNLYWAALDARWMDDANFSKGPVKFFARSPPRCVRSWSQ